MKLKKYNQYVKESFFGNKNAPGSTIRPKREYDNDDEFDIQDDNDEGLIDSDEETNINNHMGEEEEEGDEYEGTLLLKELADRLGAEVVNNSIDYNGQKINYYSETEAFHIGKMKFDTVDEVVDHLTK